MKVTKIKLLASPTNIRLGSKWLVATNAEAYNTETFVTIVK